MNSEAQARHDPDNSRYVVEVDGKIVGYTEYHLRGPGIHFFYHTEISSTYEGKGVGSVLVRYALDDVRSRGETIVPLCPFVAAWLGRHPEYNDIVNQQIMERLAAQDD